jgi:ATP-dependent Lon protease
VRRRVFHPQADPIPILPIRGMVAYPQMSIPFMVSLKSTPVIEKAMTADQVVGLLTVKESGNRESGSRPVV